MLFNGRRRAKILFPGAELEFESKSSEIAGARNNVFRNLDNSNNAHGPLVVTEEAREMNMICVCVIYNRVEREAEQATPEEAESIFQK